MARVVGEYIEFTDLDDEQGFALLGSPLCHGISCS
jgi:hypothetical protein